MTLEKGLREQKFGDWTGRYLEDLRGHGLEEQVARGWEFRPPGGENRLEVFGRAERTLREAARLWPGKKILVVTHEGVIKALVYRLLDREYLPHEKKLLRPGTLHWVRVEEGRLSPRRDQTSPCEPDHAPSSPRHPPGPGKIPMKVLFYCQHVLGLGHFMHTWNRAGPGPARCDPGLRRAGRARDLAGTCPGGAAAALEMDPGFQRLSATDGEGLDAVKAVRRETLLLCFRANCRMSFFVELYPFGRKAFEFELAPVLAAVRRRPVRSGAGGCGLLRASWWKRRIRRPTRPGSCRGRTPLSTCWRCTPIRSVSP
jgi:hypothetical protein